MSAQTMNCNACQVSQQCVFNVLNENEKQKLNEGKTLKTCKKEHFIYHEGYGASDCFMIRDGIIRLTKQSGIENECIIDFKKNGDFIGIESLGSHSKYQTSAVALTETHICILHKSLLEYFFENNKKACDYLIRSFTVNTASFLNRIVHIAKGTGQAKLARALCLVNQYLGEGKMKEIKVKREELAALSCLSRETVSRLLSSFKTRKIITVKDSAIRILDMQKMERLSEGEKK